MSPVGSTIVTDPEPLCAGHPALLTCNITEGTVIAWRYVNFSIGGTLTPASHTTSTDTVGGVLFTVALLMPTSPYFVSQLSFTASAEMNGEVVMCGGLSPSGDIVQSIILQVESIGNLVHSNSYCIAIRKLSAYIKACYHRLILLLYCCYSNRWLTS